MILGDFSFLYKFFRKYSFILALQETAVNVCYVNFKEIQTIKKLVFQFGKRVFFLAQFCNDFF